MKRISSIALSVFAALTIQAQEMPAPSPAATTTQRVGLTDVSIVYSRPAVNGRAIFGSLLPYGQLWRTGANANTTIEFSTDVMFNGKTVKAGKYSFFTIPGEKEWTLILNTDTDLWGETGYKKDNDVLRMMVAPKTTASKVERLRLSVENMTNNGASIVLAWDNTEVSLPFTVEVEKMAEANLNKAIAETAKTFRSAADFYSKKGDNDKALSYINQSIAINNYWYTNWMKAEILAAKGDTKGAIKQGELAIALGDEYFKKLDQKFTYKDGLTKTVAEWKAKK